MEQPTYKSIAVFKDPSPFKRCATSTCWHPEGFQMKVAVSYSILGFQATCPPPLHPFLCAPSPARARYGICSSRVGCHRCAPSPRACYPRETAAG